MSIRLVDAKTVPHIRSQTVYHAVAYEMKPDSPDTIILVRPEQPYVCIGYHQEVDKEVDLDFCREHDIPVVRREVGGGAVYLDENQVFTQWVFHPHRFPLKLEKRFEMHAAPIVNTYRALNIPAYFRPINDIQVAGKKIGGMGAAAIGKAEVLVTSLMFDFDFEMMARVLKVPDEKFRDKIYQSLQEYMTTMKKELGAAPSVSLVKELYLDECRNLLKEEIVPGEFTEAELVQMETLDERFASDEWLHLKGGLIRPAVKIHSGVWVGETSHKAPGGLIRATLRIRENFIDQVTLSGDFTFYPQNYLEKLEKRLLKVPIDESKLLRAVQQFYSEENVQTPGVMPDDWVQTIVSFVKSIPEYG